MKALWTFFTKKPTESLEVLLENNGNNPITAQYTMEEDDTTCIFKENKTNTNTSSQYNPPVKIPKSIPVKEESPFSKFRIWGQS